MTKIINCTPHDIMYQNKEKLITTFKTTAHDIRIETIEEQVDNIDTFSCVRQIKGKITGLPDEEKDTVYLVSRMVFDATNRKDIICPDTGKTAIRDENGQIKAVTRFIVK